MRSTLFPAWVKNVYSLSIQARKNFGQPFTINSSLAFLTYAGVENYSLLPKVLRSFPLQFSTTKNDYLPLLNSRFYPPSTPPTINNIKEN